MSEATQCIDLDETTIIKNPQVKKRTVINRDKKIAHRMKSMLCQMNSGVLEFVEIIFFTRDLCATSQLFTFESSR